MDHILKRRQKRDAGRRISQRNQQKEHEKNINITGDKMKSDLGDPEGIIRCE